VRVYTILNIRLCLLQKFTSKKHHSSSPITNLRKTEFYLSRLLHSYSTLQVANKSRGLNRSRYKKWASHSNSREHNKYGPNNYQGTEENAKCILTKYKQDWYAVY
jgi:hypothetical protein